MRPGTVYLAPLYLEPLGTLLGLAAPGWAAWAVLPLAVTPAVVGQALKAWRARATGTVRPDGENARLAGRDRP